MAKNNKVTKYKSEIRINIGIIFFAFILIYFLVSVISYLKADHVAVYEVAKGQIAQNNIYTGLILRDEDVEYADSDGVVNYYKKEKDKLGVGDKICSIDKNGIISEEINSAGSDYAELSDESLISIQDQIIEYTQTYDPMKFYNVYSFKDDINAKMSEELYNNALVALTSETDAAISRNEFMFKESKTDGILALYRDGYETIGMDAENFTPDMYKPAEYEKISFINGDEVVSGDIIYKSVSNENWSVLVPINETEALNYRSNIKAGSDTFVVSANFKKDDGTMYATARVMNYDGKYFLKLDFNSAMIRYMSDRYVEVELGVSSASGLKIPNTSITEKAFFVVPKAALTQGGNSNGTGFMKITTDKNGNELIDFVPVDVYYETEDDIYVAEAGLAEGDVIRYPDGSEEFTLGRTDMLKGVYSVNKGFAMFKIIEIIAQNEEYSIVKDGISYGIAQYDRIALDGSIVSEDQLIRK